MSEIKSHKDLVVWQKAMDLVDEVYLITDKYPPKERYTLVEHSIKTAISIPSNIAEGKRRSTRADFRKFLYIAFGSGAELETQIEIAKRRDFAEGLDFSKVDRLLDQVMRMLNKLIQKIETRKRSPQATNHHLQPNPTVPIAA